MPAIKVLDTPDVGLRPSETGVEATAGAARRGAALFHEAAESIQSVGKDANSAINAVGDVAVKQMDHEQIATGAAHGTELFDALTQSKDQVIKGIDPNDPAYGVKVDNALKQWREEKLKPALDQFTQGFTTENSQAWAEKFVDTTRNHMFQSTAADMAQAAGIGVRNAVRTVANTSSNIALLDPSSVPAQLSIVEHAIGGLVDSSPSLSGAAGAAVRTDVLEKVREQIVKAGAIGAIQKSNDPEKTAAEWVSKYPQYINGAEAVQLAGNARTQIRAQKAEDGYRLQTQKLEQQQASDDREGQYLVNMHSDDPKQRAQVSAKAIANDYTLTREARERMIAMTERENKPETDAKISRQTSVELFNGMRQDNVDPVKMKNKIDDAYSGGRLTWGDRNALIKEVEDRKTPAGLALAQDRAEFFKQYNGAIAGRSYDPVIGSPKIYMAEREARRVEQDLKQKGLDPHLAYDPSSDYFLGKPARIARWAGSMQQDLQTRATLPGNGFPADKDIVATDRTSEVITRDAPRTAGETYMTPVGKMKWTGTGWVKP